MRRLDFGIVAQAMNDAKPRAGDSDYHESLSQWCADVESLADAFTQQSSAFDRDRFFHNCGHTRRTPPGV